MGNNPQQENIELKARLHAFAAIMRLGRDAFEQADLLATAVHIVNNTRTRVVADVQVKDLEHLYRIMAKLNNQSGILDVTRG